MVEKEEFKTKINGIVEHIKNNDITNATSELLGCIDDYNSGFDELNTLVTEKDNLSNSNQELQDKINGLKDVNMELLLRLGTSKKGEPTPNINGEQQNVDDPKPLKYEDLFNEKGELK